MFDIHFKVHNLYCIWYQFVAKNLRSGQDSWYKSGIGVVLVHVCLRSTFVPLASPFFANSFIQDPNKDICNVTLWWSYWIVSGKGLMLACASSPSHRNKICREQKVLAEPSHYSLPMADTYSGIMSTEKTYGMYLGHIERKKVFLFVFWAVWISSLEKSLSLSLSLFFLVLQMQTWGLNNVSKLPVWTPFAENQLYLACILVISPIFLSKFWGSPSSSKSSELFRVSITVSDSSKR